jgi:hypothetical protein
MVRPWCTSYVLHTMGPTFAQKPRYEVRQRCWYSGNEWGLPGFRTRIFRPRKVYNCIRAHNSSLHSELTYKVLCSVHVDSSTYWVLGSTYRVLCSTCRVRCTCRVYYTLGLQASQAKHSEQASRAKYTKQVFLAINEISLFLAFYFMNSLFTIYDNLWKMIFCNVWIL